MKTFNIYTKRDGQDWKLSGEYFSASFEEAKIEFAQNCWNDLLNGKHGDNFVELSIEQDGVEEDGIYYENELFFAKSNLTDGIDFFSEDVYSWELREPLDYIEIYDLEDFENEKEKYSFFMAFDGYRFFLYNGEFKDIADLESIGTYDSLNDNFMGCTISETEFIENYLNLK